VTLFDSDLAAIEARAAAATAGPWMVSQDNDYLVPTDVYAWDGTPPPKPYLHGGDDSEELADEWNAWADAHKCVTVADTCVDFSLSATPGGEAEVAFEANAAFIAAARTDVPLLVAEVKRLRAALVGQAEDDDPS
jgi:hypothetical protein